MIGLTPAMADLVAVWGELEGVLGRTPTRRELAAELDVNVSSVQSMTVALVERGWLATDRRTLLRRLPPPDDCAVEGCAGAGLTGLHAQLLTAAIRALNAPRDHRAVVFQGLRDVLATIPHKAPATELLPLFARVDA